MTARRQATPGARRYGTKRRSGALAATAFVLALWPAPDARDPVAAPAGATTAREADRARRHAGRALLEQFQCGACHRIDGVADARGDVGPTLARLGRRVYLSGEVPNTPQTLARWIADPAALRPGTTMPALGVTPAQAGLMASYLQSLR